jgi:hypothetical protein
MKNISQLGLFFPIYGKIKIHVPNHQPVISLQLNKLFHKPTLHQGLPGHCDENWTIAQKKPSP